MSVGCHGGDVDYKLKVDASKVETSLGELNSLLTTYISLTRKAGLPPKVTEWIALLQRVRIAMQLTYKSIEMFYVATGPMGWLAALGATGMAAFTVGDLIMEAGS